jgi:hypothetical protein
MGFAERKMKNKKSKAGRKPIDDKKVRVVLFFRESQIKAKGGEEKFKQYIYSVT